MAEGTDMIVGLYNLPEAPAPAGVSLKRAFPGDKRAILDFIEKNFNPGWVGEAEHALGQPTPKCFIATEGGRVLGFACFDASALGFFGPIGVREECRGRGVGQALLLKTLNAMREYGYAYAVIGWVGNAQPFYRKTVGAVPIPGGEPQNSVYRNMINM